MNTSTTQHAAHIDTPAEEARPSILLIDDDTELCQLLTEYCQGEGFDIHATQHSADGALLAVSGTFNLVILDVMMPGMSGIEVLRRIRAKSLIPVVMLTAMGDDMDRILGLELGADDYVPKPCTPRELVARVRAILRRLGQSAAQTPEILNSGELNMWPAKRLVEIGGTALTLTGAEFSILEVLVRNAGQPVPREELYEKGLGRPLSRYDRSLDVHLSSIRHKIGTMPDGRSRIQTLRGRGYQFLEE